MAEEFIKLRHRLSSQAKTAAEQLPENQASSISFKPKDDPDAPPILELEQDLNLFGINQEQKKGECKENGELNYIKRSRTKSEDNQYTILGFLEKKIRIRIMSEQFCHKASIFQSNQ